MGALCVINIYMRISNPELIFGLPYRKMKGMVNIWQKKTSLT